MQTCEYGRERGAVGACERRMAATAWMRMMCISQHLGDDCGQAANRRAEAALGTRTDRGLTATTIMDLLVL